MSLGVLCTNENGGKKPFTDPIGVRSAYVTHGYSLHRWDSRLIVDRLQWMFFSLALPEIPSIGYNQMSLGLFATDPVLDRVVQVCIVCE